MRTTVIALLGVLLLSGCAMSEKKVVHTLENPGPVNCDTAEGDVRVLEGEKAHVAQRVAAGVTAIAPAGAALGILTRTEGTKLKVATGKYNELIEKRIAQIKAECDL